MLPLLGPFLLYSAFLGLRPSLVLPFAEAGDELDAGFPVEFDHRLACLGLLGLEELTGLRATCYCLSQTSLERSIGVRALASPVMVTGTARLILGAARGLAHACVALHGHEACLLAGASTYLLLKLAH
jgi:hypothetical protein